MPMEDTEKYQSIVHFVWRCVYAFVFSKALIMWLFQAYRHVAED